MLSDILFSTQLLITHLVMTFAVGDNHDFLGIYLDCGPKQQNEHDLSLCLTWWSVRSNRVGNHAHSVSWNHSHAPHIFHDHRDDHRRKMSHLSDWPRVSCTQCHQACDGRTDCLSLATDHHSRARDADIIFFSRNLSWLCQWHFAELITVKKKVMT